ncbi:nitrate reductase subunit alpha [Anaeromyxobacter oryzae]|uniref:Nitrate reductase subunit alpha n=1 Tax=Anaeromyxobacter oryzae TaxID=2918170 RepID=A0ABM7WP90_9BACT|nr:nitrate reductase subunit alpha [Anaeromyxobacter oryzae]BDG01270.1 nitrate reductase subunit alpha [Anaeromyxobacter oryzae]
MSFLRDILDPASRRWERAWRERHQHDRTVRSTHGVNCTGSCSRNVHVKEGIVAWESQATDYPLLEGVPPYEPRGCQRGACYSTYLYAPLRLKFPYVRGALLDAWRAAKAEKGDPVEAWASIVDDPERRRVHQAARGRGGFRRASWEEALELVAASIVHTVRRWGPDRVAGFSPIPAMSMVSFAAGSRFLQLLGGVNLSFYDWYCDLPNASPEVFGEQTDVAESADWFNSKYVLVLGANLAVTRTPDAHFLSEARYDGTKVVVVSPDFNATCRHADWWIPAHAGQDGALLLAVSHVLLSEFHAAREVPLFRDFLAENTDAPFLVALEPGPGGAAPPGRLLRASALARYATTEHGDFKFVVWDRGADAPRMPQGSLGFRWQARKGQWNLHLKDGETGARIAPVLSFLERHDAVLQVELPDFAGGRTWRRGVPVRWVETDRGRVAVATVLDLLMAQHGVGRGLAGEYPASYDDADAPFTPAWQERYTGVHRDVAIRLAREWAGTAERTGGRCSIVIGAGVNHWYHADLAYRAALTNLMLVGAVGRNGAGLNHYVGQEKLAPVAPWSQIAGALDWARPPRFQNAPSFHYVHSDQWRYERAEHERRLDPASRGGADHTLDHQITAVRRGWLPFFPQFDRSPLEVARDARAAGAASAKEIVDHVVAALKEGTLRLAVEDPDAPAAWPRVFLVWRGNALSSSAKGHEYFLRHYLGTPALSVAEDAAASGGARDVTVRDAPEGKLDLVVDLDFRMTTTGLLSDVVLPAATSYEKDDLSTTDLHSFIHPMQAAVPPCWEARSDFDAFAALAEKVSALAAVHLPDPVEDVVATAIQHDTPGEMGDPEAGDWTTGACAPEPGRTMPGLAVVTRDYAGLGRRFRALGPLARELGIGAHGISWPIADVWDALARERPGEAIEGRVHPSLATARDVAEVILRLAPETNGEMGHRAFEAEERKTGVPLADLAAPTRGVRMTFDDLAAQPRRVLPSPCWTGDPSGGRPYSAYVLNVERRVPWRTLTGRAHLYLDHPGFLAAGEGLPTWKPRLDPEHLQDLLATHVDGPTLTLAFVTPHGKWSIHSTYGDTVRMLTLSRGLHPLWLCPADAARAGIADGDWVEVVNDHGAVVTKAVVSARVPPGIALQYHAPERTVATPRSPLRGGRRAGIHNSLTRIRLKPTLMLGAYGQISWGFNYWGPTGTNRDSYVVVRRLERAPEY